MHSLKQGDSDGTEKREQIGVMLIIDLDTCYKVEDFGVSLKVLALEFR